MANNDDSETVLQLRATIKELRETLDIKNDTVQTLEGALKSRDEELKELRSLLLSTQKQRDELRVSYAELINKLAIVGRKQSMSSPSRTGGTRSSPGPDSRPSSPTSTEPPTSLHRSDSIVGTPLPPLPPPPPPLPEIVDTPTVNENSDTDFSDMEDEEDEVMKKINSTEHERRSKSPESGGESPSGRKFSRPKPIVRSIPKLPSPPKSPPSSTDNPPKIVSPKRSVVQPPSRNLSSISEEDGGSSPEQGRLQTPHSTTSMVRLPSESSLEASMVIGGGTVEEETRHSKRRATMSLSDFKKNKSLSVDQTSDSEGGSRDSLKVQDSHIDHLEMKRSRTSTISSSHRSSYQREHKRKNSKQLKQEAAKLERSPDFFTGRKQRIDLLLDPDLELRIRETISNEIAKKYGGLKQANKAATVIQSAYRQHKLAETYNKIRKEATEIRRRAQTLTHPRRNHSMLRKKRPNRYNRNISALAPNDPLLKAKLLSQDIGRAGVSHTSSRRELVERARSERSLSEGRQVACDPNSPSIPAISTEDITVEMETAVCELSLEETAHPLCADGPATDSTDSVGLPTSFSTDVLLTGDGYQRPLSIFSPVRPSTSMMDTTLEGQQTTPTAAQTLPKPRRPLSQELRERKMIMGVAHFNRKPTRGVQYLVRESVLPDSPQQVASFLLSQKGLSKEKIGEFVGEISSDFHMAVLECLLEQMDMKDKPIDDALRNFQFLFRMPGEAQKIDKIMQMFALEYYRFNRNGIIKSEDSAYILSFAIMMLHTSLHNPAVKHRTSRKQWVSMNRGINDGDNFPESYLLEIFDRINKREFITGQDHTTEVSDIEKNLVGYQNSSRLAVPQRRLVYKSVVAEIDHLTSRPSLRNRHRRLLLLFSDQVIICKKRGGDQLEYRGSFSLTDAIALSFDSHYYKYGIQIYSSHDSKAIFQCNCETSDERVKLLQMLESTINELRELEKERMAELGSSMSQQKEMEPEGSRGRMTSRAGDLLSSAPLEKPDSVRRRRESKGNYVSGVGDLVLSSGVNSSTIMRRTSRSSGSSSQPENRTSGGSHESGYDSQRTTPVPSPSPTNNPPTHYSTPPRSFSSPSSPVPPPPSSCPPVKRPLNIRTSTASAPGHTLLATPTPTTAVTVTRSRSTDHIHLTRVMTITPTLSRDARDKFSSAEDVRHVKKTDRSSKGTTSTDSPKMNKKREKSEKKKLFSSPFRRAANNRRGSSPITVIPGADSPLAGRSRAASEAPTPSTSGVPSPASSVMELELTRSVARTSSVLVNTT